MPALSKKQQKFMGIVRSIQTGDADSKNFTPRVQAVAKNMKKKDVEDFASTKHKGLPMKKEMLDKLKEMVRVELESCGYTHSVSGKKLKSSGGTGPEDRHLKEMSDKSKKIINKLGKKEKEMFLTMVDMMGFDQVMSDYKRDKKAFKQFIGYAKMGIEYQIDMSLFESVNEDGHTDVASAKRKAMLVVDDANKLLNKLNGMNKEDSLPSWLSDKITLSQNYLSKATDYLLNPVESVKESMNPSAVKKMRDEFEKTGQLPPHLKKFAKDLNAMKKKHKVKNIVVPGLEWMSDMKEVNEFRDKKEADTARDQIGNKALYMIGAKDFVFGTSGGKKSLVFKIMRNSKGVSHIRMRLSSMDLYDMEFLAIRAGKIKVKSKEKGVYGDQLGVMIKKNTGLNIRL